MSSCGRKRATVSSAVYYMGMLCLHNYVFLTDIIDYDRINLVKFIP